MKPSLNELTRKNWLKFQKSWFTVASPPRDPTKIRHPAPFPEKLAADFISFFTRTGETVLDPMVGAGSTLLACAQTERRGYGVELSPYWAEIAQQRLDEYAQQPSLWYGTVQQTLIVGDARDILTMPIPEVDYILTSPPYWDILHAPGGENQQKRIEKQLPTIYSNDPRDLGNIHDYNQFLQELVDIYRKVTQKLKSGRYMTILVRNITKGDTTYPLAWELALAMREWMRLCDEKIWIQDNVKLFPYGWPTKWVSNILHTYCLTFQKP